MSVRQPTADNILTGTMPRLKVTSGMPDSGTFTVMCWAYHLAEVSFYQDLFGQSDNNNVIGMGLYDHGLSNGIYFFNIGDLNSDITGNRRIFDDVWYHYALTIEDVPGTGTRAIGYLNGVEEMRGSLINAFPPVFCAWFDSRASPPDTDSGSVWHGSIAAIKMWTKRALTAYEIRQEMGNFWPVSRVGLYACSPLSNADTRTHQYGGMFGGNTAWTSLGTTFVSAPDPPGVSWDIDPTSRRLFTQTDIMESQLVGLPSGPAMQLRY